MKVCTACQQEKPLAAFSRDTRRGYAARCKECRKIELRKWRDKNRQAYNAAERQRYAESPAKWERHLRNKYGITVTDYMARLTAQEGRCAICKVVAEKTLAVDHDHITGVIRGLLCAECNRMLGAAKDRPEVLAAGAAYLISLNVTQGKGEGHGVSVA